MQWGRNRGGQGGPWPPHFLTQTRLNSTMILSVHKEYTDQLYLVDIGNEFVSESQPQRKRFWYIFEIRYYLNSICVQYVNFCGCGFWE